MFSDFFFIFLIYSSLSHRLISADDKTNDPLPIKDENQTLAFRNIEHLEFKFDKNTRDQRPQLECEEEPNKNRLCEKYKVLNATCSNLNYQKKDFADWRCDFNLHFHVSVYYQQLNCEYVNRTSNDLPSFFKNGTCSLTYRLELNKNHVESFKETSYLNFNQDKTVKGRKKLICILESVENGMLCKDYFYENVNCTNLNYEKDDIPKWECDLKPLSPRIITDSNPKIACGEIKLPDQKYSNYYEKNSCSLIYKLSFNEEYIETYFDTPFLKFDINLKTEGVNPKPQLQCNKKSLNDLCKNYQVRSAICTNLNYKRFDSVNWECDFKNLDSNLEAFNESIICNNFHGSLRFHSKYEKGSCYLRYSLKYSRAYAVPFRETKFLEFKSNAFTKDGIPKKQLVCADQAGLDLCREYYAKNVKCMNLNVFVADEPSWKCSSNELSSFVKIKSDFQINCHLLNPDYYKENSCQLSYKLELNSDNVKEFKKTRYLVFRASQFTRGPNPTNQLKCKEEQASRVLCATNLIKQVGCENLNYNKEMSAPEWSCYFTKLNSNVNASLSNIKCTSFSTGGIPLHYGEGTCYLEYYLKLKQSDDKETNVPKENNRADQKDPNLPLYIIIIVIISSIVLLICGICCKVARDEFANSDSDNCQRNCGDCMEGSCKLLLCCLLVASSDGCGSSSSGWQSSTTRTSGLATTSFRSGTNLTSGFASTSFRSGTNSTSGIASTSFR